jgi:hypothetical protein
VSTQLQVNIYSKIDREMYMGSGPYNPDAPRPEIAGPMCPNIYIILVYHIVGAHPNGGMDVYQF